MADSFWQGTTDGVTRVYTVPFPYIEQTDVIVQINGVSMLTPGDYSWTGTSSISFNRIPPSGNTIAIVRQTSPDTSMVSFNNGAVLTAADLNTSALQNFYRTQELQDALNVYINAGVAKYSVTGVNPFVTPSALLDAAAAAALATDLAQTLLNAQNDINLNAQNILDQTDRVNTLQATLDSLTSGVPGGIGTYLTSETNSRIAGDQALADTFTLMGAVSGGGTTFVLDTSHVYVDGTTSMATRFSALDSAIAGNTSAITSESTTRASADSTLATSITGLTSTVTSNNTTLSAAIASEASTRATADSANASSITSLSTTVAGHTSSISSQLSSINGLEAQYVVKIDVNGHVSGFGLASGVGGTSNFTIVANTFSLIDPGNGLTTPKVPFTVSGGVVSMANVVIGGALIQNATITGAKLVNATIGTAQIANAAITTALIGTAAITSATIANLAVTNAHIANLAVDTSQIANNAVTDDGSVVMSTPYSFTGSGALNKAVLTLSYTSQGGRLLILAKGNGNATCHSSDPNYNLDFKLEVDGTAYEDIGATVHPPSSGPDRTDTILMNTFIIVQPSAGAHSITMNVVTSSAYAGPGIGADSCRIVCIELMK